MQGESLVASLKRDTETQRERERERERRGDRARKFTAALKRKIKYHGRDWLHHAAHSVHVGGPVEHPSKPGQAKKGRQEIRVAVMRFC